MPSGRDVARHRQEIRPPARAYVAWRMLHVAWRMLHDSDVACRTMRAAGCVSQAAVLTSCIAGAGRLQAIGARAVCRMLQAVLSGVAVARVRSAVSAVLRGARVACPTLIIDIDRYIIYAALHRRRAHRRLEQEH